ncbi:MAG TPA: hypothetical protein DCS83_03245 [Prevotella sp.]|nr:hypothetical protein [Prevotella sp.]
MNCNTEFNDNTKSHNASYCSSRCGTAYRNSKKFEGKQEGYDYIKCPECFQKVAEVTILHAKIHGFNSIVDMANHFGVKNLKCEKIIEGMKGENNPGYQHGGKLSPWSKNNPNLSEEDLKVNYRAAEQARKGKRPNEIQSWLDKGYSEKEAKAKVSERQTTFSLDICIEKYGEEGGKKRWEERQKVWMDTLGKLPEEEKLRINKSKLSNGYSISKAEIEICEYLIEHDIVVETQFFIKGTSRGYFYDIKYNNKIIEYFGDFWHHNPELYEEDWVNPISKLNSREKQAYDEERISVAKNNGYEILIIWERDYKKNPTEVLEKCLNFLKL